ncbi:MAG: Ig-like domain-containing protein [Gammaproteobacteria bacterium]|nr:Ig-like domain-containing protein [Gammaproteobacteria bacterium]MBU1553713.1 Ig-like domain-containing protein [Gammaproteobacteria bacterium]MBU2072345.1 Ig-like domain-containing protein [Gammaproteobacteria bacterium]MBU2183847.1 Ig-like domain-containing protein [Gammaproteobacteria bacterium]MBU2203941.1 Ig-like domain-containing protein [Gammaproteobacteria bacterium]
MRNIQQLIVALIVTALAACGGGGTLDNGGTGGGGNTTPVYSLNVALTDSTGQAATALSQASPLTITATLTATNSGNVANQVIELSLSNESLASFSSTAATALTNASGVATLTLLVGEQSGAGQLTASYGTVSATAGFNSAGDGGGQVDVTVGSVSLIADTLLLGSGAGAKVELSALVRDSNNVVLAGIPVVFSSDSGELVQIDAETGNNGVAKASLSTQTNKNVRDITVTARVQQQSSMLTVSVVGTTLELAAPTSVVLGDTATIDVFLIDSNDTGIQGVEVEVSSALGNTISDTTPQTVGSAGKASFTYTAVNSGADVITVTALGVSGTANVSISADAFAFMQAATEGDQVLEVNLNTPQQLGVEWLVNNTPNIGEVVTFNTTRGEIADTAAGLSGGVTAQGTTDADGKAFTVVRSQFAGLSTVAATGGVGANAVSAKKVIEFVAVSPSKIEVQTFPAQVGPGETSAVRAIVRDAKNNPVKNQTVVFSLDNSAGGVISTGIAVTNSQGVASTVFTADTTTGGGVDGKNLQIIAALQSDNSISGFTDIAVGERTLFFRFGTGNAITKPNVSMYAKEFSIIVTDSSGNPVANQQLNVAAVPVSYGIGYWVKDPAPPESFKVWADFRIHTCLNEDVNLNGILELVNGEIGTGEDRNKDGMLTPGNAAVVPQTVTADENGIATFEVLYPQDHGAWLDIRLQISGFAAGTENVAYREYTLGVSSADTTNEASPPPRNPFGALNDCFSLPKYFN